MPLSLFGKSRPPVHDNVNAQQNVALRLPPSTSLPPTISVVPLTPQTYVARRHQCYPDRFKSSSAPNNLWTASAESTCHPEHEHHTTMSLTTCTSLRHRPFNPSKRTSPTMHVMSNIDATSADSSPLSTTSRSRQRRGGERKMHSARTVLNL